jgi:hypothetical protein
MLRRGSHSLVNNAGLKPRKAMLGKRHVIPTIFKVAGHLFFGVPNLPELP